MWWAVNLYSPEAWFICSLTMRPLEKSCRSVEKLACVIVRERKTDPSLMSLITPKYSLDFI